MHKKSKYIAILLFFVLTFQVRGQEMPALGFSNYSGVSGKNINPAFLTGSKVYLDVNILGAGVFLENNFASVPHDTANLWTYLKGDSIPTNFGPYGYNNFYTYHPNRKDYNLASLITVMGPSAMVELGKQAFGVGVSVRNYESVTRFPGKILRSLYIGESDTNSLNETKIYKNFGFSSLTWAELSLNYAYDFYERYGNKFTVGVELKMLFGVEGAYGFVKELTYSSLDSGLIRIDTLNAEAGFSVPVNYNNSTKSDFNPWAKGRGIGANIGILYTKNKNPVATKGGKALCARPYEDYKYRIGLSVLDVGRIRFNRNTQLHQYILGSVIRDTYPLNDLSTVNSAFQSLSDRLYGDPNVSLKDTTITMSLPTALSLQMDYHLKNHLYISGLWIHPLRFQNKSLRRPAQLAVIPRFETRLLGVSLPFSWYDYQQARLGLALRFYTITIGTDKLGTWLGMGNLSGMDFYFNIKFNLVKGTCLSWKRGACSSK